MYHITDLNAITDAMESAAPRPVEEVLREQYPEATVDYQGRAHAPYEGYEDPQTGTVYHAGQYLPFEPGDAVSTREGRGVWVEHKGDVYVLDGTRKQTEAGRLEARNQQTATDRVNGFGGTEGKREVFTLTVYDLYANPGYYGVQLNHVLRDNDGRKYLYKGTKLLAEVGETVTVKATVKVHHTSKDGRRSTILQRPAVQ